MATEQPTSVEPAPGAAPQVTRRTWLATAILLVAAFMELMDVTMANVAVPAIRRDTGASYGEVQWVVAGYSLTFAVALVTGGRLGDIYGRKRMFLTGLVGFMVASLLCGVAPDPGFLIGSRVLQGLAAAIMLPQVLASISVWFPEEKRAAAFGLFGAVSGLGGITAPLISGALINANVFDLHWRPIFLINLPVGIATLIAALFIVEESTAQSALRLDPIGVLTSGLAVFLVVFPVIQGRDAHWATWVWVMLALSLPALAVFLRVERWKTRRDGSPVVDLTLFRVRGFAAGLLVTVVFFAGVIAIAFVLMVFLQVGMGYNAFRAGLALVPMAIGLIVGSGISIGLSQRIGRTVLQLGSLIAVGGAFWLATAVDDHAMSLSVWSMVPPLGLLGIGLGVVVAPLSDFILAGIPVRNTGSASGLQATMIQVGSAVGVAVLGAIFFQYLADSISYPAALHRILFYDAGVFAVTGLLVFFMPMRPRPQAPSSS